LPYYIMVAQEVVRTPRTWHTRSNSSDRFELCCEKETSRCTLHSSLSLSTKRWSRYLSTYLF